MLENKLGFCFRAMRACGVMYVDMICVDFCFCVWLLLNFPGPVPPDGLAAILGRHSTLNGGKLECVILTACGSYFQAVSSTTVAVFTDFTACTACTHTDCSAVTNVAAGMLLL